MKNIIEYYKEENFEYLNVGNCYAVNCYIAEYKLSTNLFYELLKELNKITKN